MGIKIKKDTMPRLEDLPVLKIRYTMAIPLIGIVGHPHNGELFTPIRSRTDI